MSTMFQTAPETVEYAQGSRCNINSREPWDPRDRALYYFARQHAGKAVPCYRKTRYLEALIYQNGVAPGEPILPGGPHICGLCEQCGFMFGRLARDIGQIKRCATCDPPPRLILRPGCDEFGNLKVLYDDNHRLNRGL